jgi:hypothetical protein
MMSFRKLFYVMFSLFFIGQQDLLGRQDGYSEYDEYDLFYNKADRYRAAVEDAEKTGDWRSLFDRCCRKDDEALLRAVEFEKMDCSAIMKAAVDQAKNTLKELKVLAREKKSPHALCIEMAHFVGINLLAKKELDWFSKIEKAAKKSLAKRAELAELASSSLDLKMTLISPVTKKKKKRVHDKKDKKHRKKSLRRKKKKALKGKVEKEETDDDELPVAMRVADEVVTVQAVSATTVLGRFAERVRVQAGLLGNCVPFFRKKITDKDL